jgi:hypothetical protein
MVFVSVIWVQQELPNKEEDGQKRKMDRMSVYYSEYITESKRCHIPSVTKSEITKHV